jgi:hypothetical protein
MTCQPSIARPHWNRLDPDFRARTIQLSGFQWLGLKMAPMKSLRNLASFSADFPHTGLVVEKVSTRPRARRRWIREQGMLDPARLVFIDETAVSTNLRGGSLSGSWALCA